MGKKGGKANMSINKERFRKALNNSYSREILFRLYKKYFLDWIAEGYIGSNLDLFEISMISETTNKQTFLELMEQMYSKEDIFKSIFSTFSEEVQNIFEEIAWNGKYRIENKELFIRDDIEYKNKFELKDEFLFFTKISDVKKGEYLTLDNDIVRVLRKFLKKPKEYFIVKREKIESRFSDNNEVRIQENLNKYYSFYKDGKIQLSSSGKLLKECKNNMKRYCNIYEYYDDIKDLEYLKTETIGMFLFLLKEEYVNDDFITSNNLKKIVTGFLNGDIIKSEDGTYIGLYLNYLKGIKNIKFKNNEVKRGLNSIQNILKEFPEEGYVSIENIIKSILYRDEFIEIIDLQQAYSNLYINEANYERTKIIGYENYLMYVVEPFIKSVFFILSALGVFEIYYDLPSNTNSLYLKNGYLSKYDGIKYIKLTKLGRFILDRDSSYEFKVLDGAGKIFLDDTHLIVTVVGENPLAIMSFEKIGIKISPNKFKITEESFGKNLLTYMELKKRIDEFKEKLDEKLPQNWKDFFDKLEEKGRLINSVPEYRVLKIINNKELIDVITKDKRFNSLILKGEDHHIMVKNENLDKVTLILKEYGYYINM